MTIINEENEGDNTVSSMDEIIEFGDALSNESTRQRLRDETQKILNDIERIRRYNNDVLNHDIAQLDRKVRKTNRILERITDSTRDLQEVICS